MSATSNPKPFPKKIVLTPENERWLIAHFKHTKNDVIMARLGLSHSTLHRIVRELGLKKTRQFMKKMQAAAASKAKEVCIRTGRYEALKGHSHPKASRTDSRKARASAPGCRPSELQRWTGRGARRGNRREQEIGPGLHSDLSKRQNSVLSSNQNRRYATAQT